MKSPNRFALLMLAMASLALGSGLPARESVQAARPNFSIEDRIWATLEEANRTLGGEFAWETDSGTYVMRTALKEIGMSPDGSPVFLQESLIIGFGEYRDYGVNCGVGYVVPWIFHGMPACLSRKPHYLNEGYPIGLDWQPPGGPQRNGYPLFLAVGSGLEPTCAGYDAETEASCGDWRDATRPLLLAEALHQAAIENGLYEPMPEEIAPTLPSEGVPGQSEAATDQSVPANPGGLLGVPWAVVLGSLGIPIAGAFAGAALSTILSGLSSAGATELGESLAAGADKLIVEPVEASVRLTGLSISLDEINQELLNRNVYVRNPLQGDPTLVFDGLTKAGGWVWDNTAGWVTKSNGLTCGDYVDETLGKVKSIVGEQYGPGAQVQGVVFEEKSTRTPQGVMDWLDSWNPDNHNLIKVILPDGSEWAVDFHQHNTGKQPPILRPWKEAKKPWQDYMGDEFTERISVH